MGEGVQSANPFIGIYDSDYMFYSYVYDYLMYPNQDGNATPNLAKSWWHMNGSYALAHGSDPATDLLGRNASEWPSGSIWEYNLTEGVTWSDGAPFDADDVVYSVWLQTGDNYPTFWAYQPYTKWIDHAQRVDQYKVRYYFTDRTNASNPAIPVAWGSCISCPIVPKHILQDYSPVTIAQNWTGVPAIGTGPFVGTDILEDEIIAKEKITLLKNPEWERGLGAIYNRTMEIDKLVMKFYSEEQVLILDLKTKKIDATEVTAINYLSLKNATDNPPELRLVTQYSSTVYSKISHFNFEVAKAPAGLNPARCDPAIHRACGVATDREYIVSDIFKGLGVRGTGLLSPVFPDWYYDAWNDDKNVTWFNVTDEYGANLYSYHDTVSDVMDFNITLANAILDAAGYDWSGVIGEYRTIGDVAAKRLVAMGLVADEATAKTDPKTGNPRILEFEDILEQEVFEDMDISKYLASQWKQIGIKLVPTAVNTGTWNKMVYTFQEHFTETYWSGDPDPNYLLYVPSSYSMDGWNEWGVWYDELNPDWWTGSIPYYDYCYDMQARLFNKTERMHWVHECEKFMFLAGAAFMTTCFPKNAYGYLDWRWTNWGNWTEHPGLQIDHFWGQTPVFMKIKWVGEAPNNGGGMEIVAAIAIAAVVAAVAAVVVLRRQKSQKMMEEEEEETEEELEAPDEDND